MLEFGGFGCRPGRTGIGIYQEQGSDCKTLKEDKGVPYIFSSLQAQIHLVNLHH